MTGGMMHCISTTIMTRKRVRRKPDQTLVLDYDEATGARRLAGARPVVFGCRWDPWEERFENGGQGGFPPWTASPSGGERGSPSQIPLSVSGRSSPDLKQQETGMWP